MRRVEKFKQFSPSMGLTLTDLCAILLAVALALLLHDRLKQKSNLPLPPGPKKYPFVGNVLSIPRTFEWETYARWGRECGLYISFKNNVTPSSRCPRF